MPTVIRQAGGSQRLVKLWKDYRNAIMHEDYEIFRERKAEGILTEIRGFMRDRIDKYLWK